MDRLVYSVREEARWVTQLVFSAKIQKLEQENAWLKEELAGDDL